MPLLLLEPDYVGISFSIVGPAEVTVHFIKNGNSYAKTSYLTILLFIH